MMDCVNARLVIVAGSLIAAIAGSALLATLHRGTEVTANGVVAAPNMSAMSTRRISGVLTSAAAQNAGGRVGGLPMARGSLPEFRSAAALRHRSEAERSRSVKAPSGR